MTTSLFKENAFYWGTIRNLVASVGQLFQDIQIEKLDSSGQKQQVIRVPCEYGPKNKWLTMLKERPDYNQNVEIKLPRLSFEVVDYRYDAARKIGSKGSYQVGTIGDHRAKLFTPVPYDVHINVYSMCKDQTDSLQILEQILPYFAPSLTISMVVLPVFNLVKDIPIVLSSVTVEDSYDGSPDNLRTVVQTFSLVAQVDLFGPVNPRTSIIKHVKANVATHSMSTADNTFKADVNPATANVNDNYVVDERWMTNF